jgi:hypothetical protein
MEEREMIELQKQYSSARQEIEEKILTLQVRLAQHHGQQSVYPKNWGYVGDLNYVNSKLAELLEFFK